MQMRKILILPAVDDQAVALLRQLEILDEALGCADYIGHEGGIVGFEGHEVGQLGFGHQQDVDGVAGFGVVKAD